MDAKYSDLTFELICYSVPPPLFFAAVLCEWMTFENFRPDSGFQNHSFKFCLNFFLGGEGDYRVSKWLGCIFVGLFLLPINSVSDSFVKLTYIVNVI